MDFSTLGDRLKDAFLFKGSKLNPFLAPRGVFVAKGKLFVSDTGRNRVFIWNSLPTQIYQEPDVILGQENIEETGRNAKSHASASTLHYPSGIWSDGQQLIVADAWNHRVLIWHNIPTTNVHPADVVLGQPNFSQNQPNVHGQASNPDANTLNWPYGVFSDGNHLWIADTGNRRVLFYNEIPKSNFSKADRVIGKPNFTTRDYENTDPVWPYSVKVNTNGIMAIADTQFFRTLIWKNKADAFSHKADIIIGQDNFEASGQNQFRLQPEANTLNWTYDTCFYKDGILVNDTGNSRILGFDTIPTRNNVNANWLIGRPDFNTSSEFIGNLTGTQSAIYWPFSISTYGNQLFLADTGNHRILIASLQ